MRWTSIVILDWCGDRGTSGLQLCYLHLVFNVDGRSRGSLHPRCYQMTEYLPPLVFSVIKEVAFTKSCDH